MTSGIASNCLMFFGTTAFCKYCWVFTFQTSLMSIWFVEKLKFYHYSLTSFKSSHLSTKATEQVPKFKRLRPDPLRERTAPLQIPGEEEGMGGKRREDRERGRNRGKGVMVMGGEGRGKAHCHIVD